MLQSVVKHVAKCVKSVNKLPLQLWQWCHFCSM